ncbi:hypothetical protein J1605_000269 [Eschrichtius robustus]|uniref:Uncharacterized protein n=1 Tax=Eschrichtius robustus TaxID=9764 RepID=A0AB34HP85_ESCRO|nr:hypothetical protein J1605_000269 [Eschrichtius robustus]
MQHSDQQNGQNGESGGKSEGWKMLPKARPHSAGPAAGHGAQPPAETLWAPSRCSSPPVQGEGMAGAANQGAQEQGRPVRQNVTEVRDRDSADITRDEERKAQDTRSK